MRSPGSRVLDRIPARCPECGTVRPIPESALETGLTCEKCGTVFLVKKEVVKCRRPRSARSLGPSTSTSAGSGAPRHLYGRLSFRILVLMAMLALVITLLGEWQWVFERVRPVLDWLEEHVYRHQQAT